MKTLEARRCSVCGHEWRSVAGSKPAKFCLNTACKSANWNSPPEEIAAPRPILDFEEPMKRGDANCQTIPIKGSISTHPGNDAPSRTSDGALNAIGGPTGKASVENGPLDCVAGSPGPIHSRKLTRRVVRIDPTKNVKPALTEFDTIRYEKDEFCS